MIGRAETRRRSRRSSARARWRSSRDARRARCVVVGDVMLDHFMIGRVSRISPEAPVPVVEFEREFSVPGGAANVAAQRARARRAA